MRSGRRRSVTRASDERASLARSSPVSSGCALVRRKVRPSSITGSSGGCPARRCGIVLWSCEFDDCPSFTRRFSVQVAYPHVGSSPSCSCVCDWTVPVRRRSCGCGRYRGAVMVVPVVNVIQGERLPDSMVKSASRSSRTAVGRHLVVDRQRLRPCSELVCPALVRQPACHSRALRVLPIRLTQSDGGRGQHRPCCVAVVDGASCVLPAAGRLSDRGSLAPHRVSPVLARGDGDRWVGGVVERAAGSART